MPSTTSQQVDLDFAFFTYLRIFYNENRGQIRSHFRDLSKKVLDFNDPDTGGYLWEPQFYALEMYVFLKEYLNNRHVHQIFADWHAKKNGFEKRSNIGVEQLEILGELDTAQYQAVFDYIRKFGRQSYPNYIFALPMGTGKTYLMATCIFYEFLLANRFSEDPKYCHNALVFAPDRTVLQSLKKILTFDMEKVVPSEYVNFLSTHIQFHFLEEAGTALSTIDQSRFNLIISNTQKIILKQRHTEQKPSDRMFNSGAPTHQRESVYDEFSDLYADSPEDEKGLILNQRFQKLTRLEQLGIFVDEAHHAFGSKLANDMGLKSSPTSLRLTIDELAASLGAAGTQVCACYNFTGTPYVKERVLPEVVYGYGLKEAIDKSFLKKVKLNGYTNTQSTEFVKLVINDFWENHSGQRYEGMLPKLAFFASTIEELKNELRPAVESVLISLGISTDSVLINVGDSRLTTNDELREFINLDTPASEKQFILLVNKGREGWDCRSLFGVALHRKPIKSKIFVLQASMRCLRQIGQGQQTGHVYLSEENLQILDDELRHNFRLSVEKLRSVDSKTVDYKVHVKKHVEVLLKRVRKSHELVGKSVQKGLCLKFEQAETEDYRLEHIRREGWLASQPEQREDVTEVRERREFSQLTLCAEIARYLNRSPLDIEDILTNSKEGMKEILERVNEFNELLYDWIIPRLFDALYDLREEEHHDPEEVALVKKPETGYYTVRAKPHLVVTDSTVYYSRYKEKSFHLNIYAFDSNPEKALFGYLLSERGVKEIYFTGMLTHGQSDFFIQYIDPESYTVRRYYPDFVMLKEDGSWVIVEVKADNKIDDKVVQAKAIATWQRANASRMSYSIIAGSEAERGMHRQLL